MVCFHNHLNRLLLLSSVLLLGWARPVVLFLCSPVSLDTRVRSVLFPGLYPSLRQGGRSRAGRQGQCGGTGSQSQRVLPPCRAIWVSGGGQPHSRCHGLQCFEVPHVGLQEKHLRLKITHAWKQHGSADGEVEARPGLALTSQRACSVASAGPARGGQVGAKRAGTVGPGHRGASCGTQGSVGPRSVSPPLLPRGQRTLVASP